LEEKKKRKKRKGSIRYWPIGTHTSHAGIISFIHSVIYLLRITSANKTVCNAM